MRRNCWWVWWPGLAYSWLRWAGCSADPPNLIKINGLDAYQQCCETTNTGFCRYRSYCVLPSSSLPRRPATPAGAAVLANTIVPLVLPPPYTAVPTSSCFSCGVLPDTAVARPNCCCCWWWPIAGAVLTAISWLPAISSWCCCCPITTWPAEAVALVATAKGVSAVAVVVVVAAEGRGSGAAALTMETGLRAVTGSRNCSPPPDSHNHSLNW